MRKIVISTVLSLLLFSNCNKKETSGDKPEEHAMDSIQLVSDHHNAKNSLDYIGVYKGIVPCADCEGIEITLEILEGESYSLKRVYLGKKSPASFERNGSYTWDESGNTIILDNGEDSPYQYRVMENAVMQLDMEGNEIKGELAGKYLLQKQIVTASKTSSMVSGTNEINLPGSRWKLIELEGKEIIISDPQKEYTLEFLEGENRFTAFMGCNRMGGIYEVKDPLRITFSKVISTLMACPDMQAEDRFKDIIEKVDNYTVQRNVLSLNKAKMAPLARFERIR